MSSQEAGELDDDGVTGILWGSDTNDFDTAVVITHMMGVDVDDVHDMAAVRISESDYGFYWFSVANKPCRVTIECNPQLVGVSNGW